MMGLDLLISDIRTLLLTVENGQKTILSKLTIGDNSITIQLNRLLETSTLVQESTSDAVHICDDLLLYDKHEDLKMTLSTTPVAIATIIETIVYPMTIKVSKNMLLN